MSFLSKLFDNKEREKKPPPATPHLPAQPAQRRPHAVHIPYDTHLVAELDAEHQKLLALFTDISQSFAAGDMAHAAAGLRKFTSAIQAHLLTEQIGLYVYLEDVLTDSDSQQSRTKVYDIHHAMDTIGQTVLDFLNKYRLLDKKPELQATFGAELAGIGAALVERIKLEKTALYPMYDATAPAG